MTATRRSINIYDYPEHLNPFYEGDNHRRLRFWDKGKRIMRANSFSISDIKTLPRQWSFRSKTKTESQTSVSLTPSPRPEYIPRRVSTTSKTNGFIAGPRNDDLPPRPSSALAGCVTDTPTSSRCGTLTRKKRRAPLPPTSAKSSIENVCISKESLQSTDSVDNKKMETDVVRVAKPEIIITSATETETISKTETISNTEVKHEVLEEKPQRVEENTLEDKSKTPEVKLEITEAQSVVSESKPKISETKPKESDIKPLEDIKTSEVEPDTLAAKVDASESKPKIETKPETPEPKPRTKIKTVVSETKLDTLNTQQEISETKPKTEIKTVVSETELATVNAQPEISKSKSEISEAKSEISDAKPNIETKPEASEDKPKIELKILEITTEMSEGKPSTSEIKTGPNEELMPVEEKQVILENEESDFNTPKTKDINRVDRPILVNSEATPVDSLVEPIKPLAPDNPNLIFNNDISFCLQEKISENEELCFKNEVNINIEETPKNSNEIEQMENENNSNDETNVVTEEETIIIERNTIAFPENATNIAELKDEDFNNMQLQLKETESLNEQMDLLAMVQKLQMEVQQMTFDDLNDNPLVSSTCETKYGFTLNNSNEVQEFEQTTKIFKTNTHKLG